MTKLKNSVARSIEAQLKENTGAALADSGDVYGRAWERNQGKDLSQDDIMDIDISNGETVVTLSTFHYLNEWLKFDSLTDGINRYLKENDCTNIQDALEEVYGLGYIDDSVKLDNTYNYSAPLSQDLVYFIFEHNGNKYVILSTHNGCDIRGGYSDPVCYKVYNNDSYEHNYFLIPEVAGTDSKGEEHLSTEGYFDFEASNVRLMEY